MPGRVVERWRGRQKEKDQEKSLASFASKKTNAKEIHKLFLAWHLVAHITPKKSLRHVVAPNNQIKTLRLFVALIKLD